MAQNEIVVKPTTVLSVESKEVALPDFKNVKLGEEPRRLKINVRKKKNAKGELFNSITGYVKLPVYEGIKDVDELNYIGIKTKQISVHFRKGAFKGSANVTSPEDEEMKSGYLYVKAKGLRIPNAYIVKAKKDDEDNLVYDKDGELVVKYPEIWIESDVLGLEAFVTSQSALDVDTTEEDSKVVDAEIDEETGEVLEDDSKEAVSDLENETSETEETTI